MANEVKTSDARRQPEPVCAGACANPGRSSQLCRRLLAGLALAGSLSASAAATTYVVPAGTAGNAPEEPYDTWAKAANDPRTAADATDKNGTVYILGGDYSSFLRIAPEQNVHVRIVATQATDGAPGEMSMGNVLSGHTGSAAADTRLFQVDYGTIRMMPSGGNVFTEYLKSGGAWGSRAKTRFVITGPNTKVNAELASSTYAGYTTAGYEMTVADGASFVSKFCTAALTPNADGMKLSIVNGASFVCGGEFRFGVAIAGQVAKNGLLTVSNATLCVTNSSFCIGADGRATNVCLVTAGERPLVYALNASGVYGEDCRLVMNVAEAPLDGYASRTVRSVTTSAALHVVGNFTIGELSGFELTGVDALAARLAAAGRKTGAWRLIQSGGTLTIGHGRIEAINAQLAAAGIEGIRLTQDGSTLWLKHAPATVYITPAGTAGNVPAVPYESWTAAANSVKTGAQEVVVGGTVVIASGTYDYIDPSLSGIPAEIRACLPVQRAVFRAVASASDPSPGTVVLANRGFASGHTKTGSDSYDATFACGTFSFALNSSKQCFLEYTENGVWGSDNQCHLTVTGPSTVLDDAEADFYVGYTSKNALLHVTDRARVYSNNIQLGANVNGYGATIVIDGGAAVTNSGACTLGYEAGSVGVTVSNGTLRTWSLRIGRSSYKSTDNWCRVLDGGVLSVDATATFSPFQASSADSGFLLDASTFGLSTTPLSFANPGTNNVLIVRNGAKMIGKSLVLGSAGKNADFVCRVENAAVDIAEACTVDGNATLALDVSDAAFDGTAPAFVSAGTMTIGGDATVTLAGVDELLSRVLTAKAAGFKLTLLKTTGGLTIPAATVQALAESLPEGAVLFQTSTALRLRVGPPAGSVVIFR